MASELNNELIATVAGDVMFLTTMVKHENIFLRLNICLGLASLPIPALMHRAKTRRFCHLPDSKISLGIYHRSSR
jgi:hypothetical protein